MGSTSFAKSRRRSPLFKPRKERYLRRQSPGGPQRSPSVGDEDVKHRMGLRRSRPQGPYDTIDNLPTTNIANYIRGRHYPKSLHCFRPEGRLSVQDYQEGYDFIFGSFMKPAMKAVWYLGSCHAASPAFGIFLAMILHVFGSPLNSTAFAEQSLWGRHGDEQRHKMFY